MYTQSTEYPDEIILTRVILETTALNLSLKSADTKKNMFADGALANLAPTNLPYPTIPRNALSKKKTFWDPDPRLPWAAPLGGSLGRAAASEFYCGDNYWAKKKKPPRCRQSD